MNRDIITKAYYLTSHLKQPRSYEILKFAHTVSYILLLSRFSEQMKIISLTTVYEVLRWHNVLWEVQTESAYTVRIASVFRGLVST
jgi:Fe2+ or Zn2+ uptake regulation protein